MPTADGQLTAAELAQIYALVQAQAAIREQLTQIAVAGALAPLRLLTNWYDEDAVRMAAIRIVRIVQPAQRRMAQVTDAYLARMLTIMTGRTVRPIGAVDITQLRRAVTPDIAHLLERAPVEIKPDGDLNVDRFFRDEEPQRRRESERERPAERDGSSRSAPATEPDPAPEPEPEPEPAPLRSRVAAREVQPYAVDPIDVYRRVAAQYRYQVSVESATEQVALQRALERASTVARTDIALAARAQNHQVLTRQDPREVIGYRRVLRPELGSGEPPCGLCIVAADRFYWVKELDKIHDNCRCIVVPVLRGKKIDPGFQLNREDLDRLYKAAGGTDGWLLKRVRAVVTEHGELGPILVDGDQKHRGPRQAAASSRRNRGRTPEPGRTARDFRLGQIEALEESIAALQRLLARGENVANEIAERRRRIEELRRTLAAL